MWPRALPPLLVLALFGAPGLSFAQPRVTASGTILFYADNTEFNNRFRDGETLFGAAIWLVGTVAINDRVSVKLGAFGNHRFGSDEAFDLVRPVVALEVRGRRSLFTIGAMDTLGSGRESGPDHDGPHDLLPPLQRETLVFERPHEEGLQWTFRGTRVRHEMWVNWQRLNTPEHRERYDAGASVRLRIHRWAELAFQGHYVHAGGQLFMSGPVSDSLAGGPGVRIEFPEVARTRTTIETYGLVSRYVPDRSLPGRSMTGLGTFYRLAAERLRWRGHILFWRSWDYAKDEGDANYQFLLLDGRLYRKVRDYSEAGLARPIALGPETSLEVSARVHRVEGDYDYSFRILATTRLSRIVR